MCPENERAVGFMSQWIHRAACRDEDPELFWPAHESKPNQHPTVGELAALAVCVGCPVQPDCLRWALSTGQTDWGVLGGRTAAQRKAAVRARNGTEPYPAKTAAA